ncbi:hypothetical protein A3H90_02450 [Candidatus Peribacteria bacterium RIFCSPLOWO2_02_FULL_55_36]|nr:MAG: hypothetical protein A3D12_03360 [Candidatus Peribacteria bacterium RIFCSPHIGHO2_02_FULL_55_24]OGJ63619.1 MAG: hypothetical protein A3E47_00265 [Candidatus Peribacteria bacterium RIFCSPHIGHO2_12_FULL_54_10]OGJ69498.1 MAG: hypothetical protein A3H90_02450 [Candidatus Peribacteria bacterium RIFCSPLOWO2_02_FULL_55_36]
MNDPMLLFCASDAGGARELIPVIAEAKNRHIAFRVLCSPVTAPIFAAEKIDAEECTITSVDDAEHFLSEKKIHALIVGTAGEPKTEHELTAAAKKIPIRSISVLDEWFSFTTRFEDENGELGPYIPNIICVQDETAYTFAREDGLPAEILRITGSPSLAKLTGVARKFSEDPPDCPDILKETDRPTILFLSQPLRRAYGEGPGDKGTHGAFMGYHEDMVREDLAEILTVYRRDVRVLEKMHPSEGDKPPPATGANVEWCMEAGSHALWPLLWHAHCIVGMSTKALLEAGMLGRSPLSYQPNARDPEVCSAVRLGFAELITTKQGLEAALRTCLERPLRRGKLRTLPCANPDAASKILALAEECSSEKYA